MKRIKRVPAYRQLEIAWDFICSIADKINSTDKNEETRAKEAREVIKEMGWDYADESDSI